MFHMQYDQHNLRYRGKDPKIKSAFERKTKSKHVFSEYPDNQSVGKLTSIHQFYSSIRERPEYNAPPKGGPVSYAYGLAPTVLDTMWAEVQVLYQNLASQFGFDKKTINATNPSVNKSQAISNRLLGLIKSTPHILKPVYDVLSFPEKEFIKNVSTQVAQNHLSKMAMTALNIGPLSFTVLAILASAGVVSAESSPIVKRIAKLPLVQDLKNALDDAPYTFVDGIPPNGTDMCAALNPYWNYCEQFYVKQNNSTILTSVSTSEYSGKPPANYGNWPCLGTDGMKQNIKTILDDPRLVSKLSGKTPECIGIDEIVDSTAFSKVDGLSIPGCLKLNDLTADCIRPSPGITMGGFFMIAADVVMGVFIMGIAANYLYRRRLLAKDKTELEPIAQTDKKNVNSGVTP